MATKKRFTLAKVLIPVGIAGTYYLGTQYLRFVRDEDVPIEYKILPEKFVSVIKTFPTRAGSRLWGAVNEVDLPVWARRPILKLYSSVFGCKLDEAANGDLLSYPNLQAFFGRQLKAGSRVVDNQSAIVSPADSRVLHFGTMTSGTIEQVKGVSYKVADFLGTLPTPKPGNKIFQIVLYLAPGDYHHFHSPTKWAIQSASHYHGELFSVSPFAATILRNLFILNERVVLRGTWQHGFFAYVAVGAYNVGSIKIDCLPDLLTDNAAKSSTSPPNHVPPKKDLLELSHGDHVGSFRLGSTVVLVFEAPETFAFTVTNNAKVEQGQRIGKIPSIQQ